MEGRKQIPISVRNIVVSQRKEGKSYGEISKIVKISRATVQTILRNYRETNSTENKPRTGRPKKLSRHDVSSLLKEVKRDPKLSAPKLAEHLQNCCNVTVTSRTVINVLHDNGFKSRVARKKPLISAKNRKLRLEFARAHLNKDVDFWKRVIFTDESKFNVFGNDGRSKVWRKPNTALDPQNIIPTVKHGGGSVMVWGAMASSGVGRLVFVEGNMDRYQYKNILEHNLKASVDSLCLGNQWIFQQDNDPKHTAHVVRDWLLYYAPRQLNSPPQSPDLNPIEHIWDVLDKKVRKYDISSRETLKTALIRAWSEITPDITENLVNSMPRRLQAVIDAQGGPTKY
ncbi:Transposable element Tcb1 transposase [Eumeta japonica]|uniref:Transposable element Tcb1 transposase n=1 Tax=Eumeta variegata TaxID=151549 RepID=A0A4C1SMI9_EUMVA|nr:Transposable element Tcb1 transposase [Eumeta japonica]